MLSSTSTSSSKIFLLWTASLAVAVLSGFGIGLYVSSRPVAPKVENLPNAGVVPRNSDDEDDINDLEAIAKVKAGILEPCKMARTLYLHVLGVLTIFVDPRGENRPGYDQGQDCGSVGSFYTSAGE
jgi:hypothetical protein